MIVRPTATHAVALAAAITATTCLSVSWALGLATPRLNLLFTVLGALMIVTGNIAGKLPHGHAMGFRSPWALDDAEVWDKTQRFGGWVLVIAGLLVLNASLLFGLAALNWITLIATCSASLLVINASSYFARRKRKARDAAWRELAR
ncbi:MAG: SdpI family protein [Alphaproteobacteria bacterium]|nr:SdpI family protein [Alphaproteobacteria bacterium]MBL6939596.1 SdpI family protein [Alphaproteobacteria bacterium]MBL7100031.1 SdpI family protein [Alphaproteobacteria bacterium]